MIHYKNLNDFFSEVLTDLSCERETQSYIVSVFCKYKSSSFDLSNQSLTILYSIGKSKMDFNTFQNIGDWIMFCGSLTPGSLKDASEDYYNQLAQISYYNCFRIINKKWVLFEELSDNFVEIRKEIQQKLKRNLP